MSGTTLSTPGVAQPVLFNAAGFSSESNGIKGGAQLSSEQRSALSHSNSMTQSSQSQSMQRQESSYSSMSRSESYDASYEYRARTRLTLADCQLELKAAMLTIRPKASGVEFKITKLNLDDLIGNLWGELVWGERAFSASCKEVHLEGTLLVAMCEREDREFVKATLDLNEHIIYTTSRRCFEAIVADADFTQLMTSAGWMNVHVITQPDMRGFLTNPAFQATIRGVAQRAVDEVITEMREEMMQTIERAVSAVSLRSSEYVSYEMESLTKRATLRTGAAYSGLGELTVMSQEQRRAYNIFHPHLHLGHGHGHGLGLGLGSMGLKQTANGKGTTVPDLGRGHEHVHGDGPVGYLRGLTQTAIDYIAPENGHLVASPVPEANGKGKTVPETNGKSTPTTPTPKK